MRATKYSLWPAVLLIICAAHAHGAVITEVADSSAGYSSFSPPSVNNAGTVAFNATTNGTAKIFTGAGGGPVIPALDAAPNGFTGLFDAPSINNLGQIAFIGVEPNPPNLPSFQSAFRLDPGSSTPVRIYDAVHLGNNVTTVTTAQVPDLVFARFTNQFMVTRAGAASGTGGPPTTLLPTPGLYHDLGRIAASASGDWTVNAAPTFVGQFHRVIRNGATIADSSITTFTDPPFTGTLDSFGDTDTSSDGTVVFSANFAAVYNGIFSYKNGVVTRLYKSFPGSGGFTGISAINDNGLVAALVAPANAPASKSILYGFGPLDQPLISVGDPLAQSTVTDLAFIHDGLSENGNLAFYAALADGRTGIFVTNVPEPATCAALITLLAPAALFRRRPPRI